MPRASSGCQRWQRPVVHWWALTRPRLLRIARLEPWLVLPSTLGLLLYPSPLVGPAAVIGLLPSAARWVVMGRPWTRTAFDLPFALLLAGTLLGAWAGLNREGAATWLAGLLAGLLLYVAIL